MSLRIAIAGLALALAAMPADAKTFAEMFPGKTVADAKVQEALSSFDYQQGEIKLAGAAVTLTIPSAYYYLNAADAAKAAQLFRGNKASVTNEVLGAIFPADVTAASAPWSAGLFLHKMDHLLDADAVNIDLQAGLKQFSGMIADDDRYISLEWAMAPAYDATSHVLHFPVRMVGVKGTPDHLDFVNYVLGNEEALAIALDGRTDAQAAIEAAVPAILAMAKFDEGHRYEDYGTSSLDTSGHEPTLAQIQDRADAESGTASDQGGSTLATGWFIFRWTRRILSLFGVSTWALICAAFVGMMTFVGRFLLFAFNTLDNALPGTPKGNAAIDRLANLQARAQR